MLVARESVVGLSGRSMWLVATYESTTVLPTSQGIRTRKTVPCPPVASATATHQPSMAALSAPARRRSRDS